WVRDGAQAISYLTERMNGGEESRLPTVVMLDVNMPRVNGHEVLRWVRQQPSLRQLVVVMFTTSDEPADVEEAYCEGANSFLVKPTDFLELLPRIRCFAEYWLEHNVPPQCKVSSEKSAS